MTGVYFTAIEKLLKRKNHEEKKQNRSWSLSYLLFLCNQESLGRVLLLVSSGKSPLDANLR